MTPREHTGAQPETTPEAVQQRVAAGEPLLILDVRSSDEYWQGHVPGSTLLPLDQLAARLDEVSKDRPIVAVCRSGNRSGVATAMLRRAGFDAVNMKGGMLAWEKANLPVERAQ